MSLGATYQHVPKLGVEIKVKKEWAGSSFGTSTRSWQKASHHCCKRELRRSSSNSADTRARWPKGRTLGGISRTDELVLPEVHLEGVFVTNWGTYGSGDGQFGGIHDGPYGVAVAPEGSVYVANWYNGRIQKFSVGP